MIGRSTARAALVLIAVSTTWSGCQQPLEPLRPPLPPPIQDGVALNPLSRQGQGEIAGKVLAVRLRLIVVSLPIGSVSDSEQLWSYLNEEPAGAKIGPCLAYNGIRVGSAPESAWPDIAKLLRQLSGQTLRRSHVVAHPGSPLPIVLKARQGEQTIFTYRRERTLFGRDYPSGDNVLMVTAGIDWEKPSCVYLTVTPLIRTSHRRMRFVEQPVGYVLTAQPSYFPLKELDFQFKIPPGGFLLIGPGPEARRETSPGHHFLVRQRRGAKFETVLVIAPEVFAAPVRKAP